MSTQAQRSFMNQGGVYAAILQAKHDSGELVPPERYEHQDYPKEVRISRGMKTVEKSTTRVRGKEEVVVDWTEEVEDIERIIVHSEAEEERVRNGGKSEDQIEEERLELYTQCRQRGLSIDRSWPLFRLQQALGTAPTASEVSDLRAKVADLEEKAALRQQIAELERQLSGAPVVAVDEAEQLRAELKALGVQVDGRWSVARMRSELERATEPA